MSEKTQFFHHKDCATEKVRRLKYLAGKYPRHFAAMKGMT